MPASFPAQPTLFERGDPAVDAAALSRLRRTRLDDDSWVEHLPDWVAGEQALMDRLVRETAWRSERRRMYDRTVEVPRLVASLPADGPGHPLRPVRSGATLELGAPQPLFATGVRPTAMQTLMISSHWRRSVSRFDTSISRSDPE